MRKENALMPSLMVFAGAEASTPVLSGVVTAAMLNGVFNEIVGLLPVIVPVSVGFIAIRKGLESACLYAAFCVRQFFDVKNMLNATSGATNVLTRL